MICTFWKSEIKKSSFWGWVCPSVGWISRKILDRSRDVFFIFRISLFLGLPPYKKKFWKNFRFNFLENGTIKVFHFCMLNTCQATNILANRYGDHLFCFFQNYSVFWSPVLHFFYFENSRNVLFFVSVLLLFCFLWHILVWKIRAYPKTFFLLAAKKWRWNCENVIMATTRTIFFLLAQLKWRKN